MWTKSTVLLILLASLANWLPKVFPYVLVRFAKLPPKALAFLSYLPVSIMFAMLLSSILPSQVGQFPQFKWVEALALIPTYLVLRASNNLVWTVLVGVGTVALLRQFMG